MHNFEARAGEDISNAARRAIEHSKRFNMPVTFDFNGVACVVVPDSLPENTVSSYHAACARRRSEYEASPEGKRAAQESERERVAVQRQVLVLEEMFTHYWEDARLFRDDTLEPLLDWLKQYALAVDRVGVTANPEPIIKQLNAAGFTAGMHVTKDESLVAKWTPRISAEWIVGQALSMGLRSHPGMFCGALRFWRKRCEAYDLSVKLEP